MFNPTQVPPSLRMSCWHGFIIFSKHFRPSDNTVKPDAFIPHPLAELSVTRHCEATDGEIWQEGERVAAIRSATLYGRGDVKAVAFEDEDLSVVANAILENPNHADVIDWPADKPAQKMKAREIANKALFVPKPS